MNVQQSDRVLQSMRRASTKCLGKMEVWLSAKTRNLHSSGALQLEVVAELRRLEEACRIARDALVEKT